VVIPGYKYLRLLQLARKRLHSEKDYLQFQQYQAMHVSNYIRDQYGSIIDSELLDLGCGIGGYSIAMQMAGAHVISLDRNQATRWPQHRLVQGDANASPFAEASIDIIICASLIEHVPNPRNLLLEIHRLLRPDGIAFVSFPPFYSPLGGHQFSPFHYAGEQCAIAMASKTSRLGRHAWLKDRYTQAPKGFKDAFGNWGLYKMTISGFEKLIDTIPLSIVHRSSRWFPINLTAIPILREILTLHVQYLLTKNT